MYNHNLLTQKALELRECREDNYSAGVQCAMLQDEIEEIESQMQKGFRDKEIRLDLLRTVGKRRRLLNYLKSVNLLKYNAVIQKLGLKE